MVFFQGLKKALYRSCSTSFCYFVVNGEGKIYIEVLCPIIIECQIKKIYY